jgi:hypothetical protein
MKDYAECLKQIGKNSPSYYFLVQYHSDGIQTETKNPSDAQDTLKFYRSLPVEQKPQILFCLTVVIDGTRHSYFTNLSEDECERIANDTQYWEGRKQSIKAASAAALMLEF